MLVDPFLMLSINDGGENDKGQEEEQGSEHAYFPSYTVGSSSNSQEWSSKDRIDT
jgi:hypothetical protein